MQITPQMSSYEIGIIQDEKIKEKMSADEHHKVLKQEIISVQYEIAKLRVRQKELESKLNESDFIQKKLKSELERLKLAYWNAKDSGI